VRSRRPLLTLAIVVPIALVCLLLLLASRGPAEPTYKELTMIDWLRVPDKPAQEEAISILGTNNLQMLVHRLNYDPTKDRVFALYSRLPDQLKNAKPFRSLGLKNPTRAAVAAIVMRRLGPRAAPAVPELAQLAKNASQPVALPVLIVLGSIGDQAVPGIVAGMSNTNQSVRGVSLFLLQQFTNSALAWHAITNALADTDLGVRQQAGKIAAGSRLE
jgi:hypothetical protein